MSFDLSCTIEVPLACVTQLDAMKIVIITYMISYSLNGQAQLSSKAESVFLSYVLCVLEWIR